jgi:hypothetical protein
MEARTVGQQTRGRHLVIPARASRSTYLCALCGEIFVRGRRGGWRQVLQKAVGGEQMPLVLTPDS